MSKETGKKLSDYLHLYLGAEIQIEYGYPDDKKIGVLTGLRAGAGWEIWPHKESWVRIPKGERVVPAIVRDDLVKPILRPLSDMTEEERVRVALWEFPMYKTADVVKNDSDNDFFVFRNENGMRCNVNLHHFSAETTRKLLQAGFDLFGLIESGLAIDKIKLNP